MDKNLANKRIILASQSPRRHSLIKKIISDFDVVTPEFDEKLDSDNYSDDSIKTLSLQKAMSVLSRHEITGTGICTSENSFIISADTMVVLENKIYGKPEDEKDAIRMLKELSGQKHFVVTAVTVLDSDTKKALTDVVKTHVTFQDLSDELIESYVKSRKPLDKAGAYGIQEMGNEFIKSVEGDMENVIGFPTEKVKELLSLSGFSFGEY